MKKVVNTDQVAHLWAHKAQSEARNQQRNFYFDGDTIYSYGPHFPIARHVDDCVLLTTKRYSVTTAKQQGIVAGACSHLTRFFVPNIRPVNEREHRENFKAYQAEYDELGLKAARAKKHVGWHLEAMQKLETEANAYAIRFGLDERLEPADMQELKNRATQQAAIKREQTAAERARHDREYCDYLASVETWRKGGAIRRTLGWDNPHIVKVQAQGALLRIQGDNVQTSQGAEFPITDVPAAWKLIEHCVIHKFVFQSNGKQIKLGAFRLDSVSVEGDVKAGCHFVKYAECLRLAEQLGLVEKQAA